MHDDVKIFHIFTRFIIPIFVHSLAANDLENSPLYYRECKE